MNLTMYQSYIGEEALNGVLLLVDESTLSNILAAAHRHQISGSHAFFWIQTDTYSSDPASDRLLRDQRFSHNADFENFFTVSPHTPKGITDTDNVTVDAHPNTELLDAFNFVCHSTLLSSMHNNSLLDYLQNMQFMSSNQQIVIGPKNSLLVDYVVHNYDSQTSSFREVIRVGNSLDSIALKVTGDISWFDSQLSPHDCFLSRELCQTAGVSVLYLLYTSLGIISLSTVSVVMFFLIRKYRSKREMEKGPNKILLSNDDIVFIHKKSMTKHQKTPVNTFPVRSDRPDILKTTEPSFSMTSLNDYVDFSDTARYCGETVHVKDLFTMGFEVKAKLLSFLKSMRDMRHENINPFLGFLNDQNRPAVITEFCTRGSLEDVIQNEDIKLDWDFKLSLLTDLIRGMRYIHTSHMRHHGHLKSRNCVIDSRWVLKLTDYGIPGIHAALKITKKRRTIDLLWTAPELLRDPILMQQGSEKGDIYSMAIIMQEVILRTAPYSTTGLSPEEIIAKVRKPPPLIRPSVSKQAAPPEYILLMKQCWAEMPDMRPDIENVYQQYKSLNHGKKMNIVDTMFKMLEKYSNDLEEIVHDRTMLLEEEKKKTDQLLFRMLPASVAENLKIGRPIQAETFSEVTIYFSDVVGFTTISAMSTPMQVVDLLNDLYTTFDATIDIYDVYKVETIGDAYMVVSGLPLPNGNRHSGEIATMALDLLSQCGTFTIRHMPHVPLRLRIGLHSGSCVAGVVGLTMPRYCLFGDTVNTASRMESTGAAFRIHISESTKLQLDELKGYHIDFRGEVELKGKGVHKTYWLVGKDGYDKPLPNVPCDTGLESLCLKGITANDKDDAQTDAQTDVKQTPKNRTSLSDIVLAITSLKRAVHNAVDHSGKQTESHSPPNDHINNQKMKQHSWSNKTNTEVIANHQVTSLSLETVSSSNDMPCVSDV